MYGFSTIRKLGPKAFAHRWEGRSPATKRPASNRPSPPVTGFSGRIGMAKCRDIAVTDRANLNPYLYRGLNGDILIGPMMTYLLRPQPSPGSACLSVDDNLISYCEWFRLFQVSFVALGIPFLFGMMRPYIKHWLFRKSVQIETIPPEFVINIVILG